MRNDNVVDITSKVCVDFDRGDKPIVLIAGGIKLYFDPSDAKTCAEALMEAIDLYDQGKGEGGQMKNEER
ncbi:MAG: hypothetical protein ACR2RE_00270 [Geminicoccaceae bacterium]